VCLSKIYDILLSLSFGHCIVCLSKFHDVLLPFLLAIALCNTS
jgi:hypothetical protein